MIILQSICYIMAAIILGVFLLTLAWIIPIFVGISLIFVALFTHMYELVVFSLFLLLFSKIRDAIYESRRNRRN